MSSYHNKEIFTKQGHKKRHTIKEMKRCHGTNFRHPETKQCEH
uniref:Uncharacterized protein n=1 Tax=Rhizophora mucronata TaxID=61149 RepID=A0A2P2PWB7_RHIMU